MTTTTQPKVDETEVLTPHFFASFPHIFKSKAFKDREPMYSVQMLFPKGTDLTAMKKAAAAAARKKWGDNVPEGLKSPFKDGNKNAKKYESYKDMTVVECKSKQKPGIVNQKREEIIDSNEIYPGVKLHAKVVAFAYENSGNKGVSFGLRNLQKVGEGKRFDSRKDPKDDFDFIEGFEGEGETSEVATSNDDLADMF